MICMLTWIILVVSLVFMSWSSSILSMALSFFFVIFSSSMSLALKTKNTWFMFIFLIFLLGGLMVSFSYVISVNHNNMLISKFYTLSFLVISFFYMMVDSNYYFFKEFSMGMDFSVNVTQTPFISIVGLVMILLLMLYMVDEMVGKVKGNLRSL